MVIFVILAAFLGSVPTNPDDYELPSYAEYFDYAILPLGLFAAVVAPLLVCPDRRDGVLALYAARPITPRDYTASRWAAFFTITGLIAFLPVAVLFFWNALDARDFRSWLGDNWDVLPRSLLVAVLVAGFYTTLSLLVASFTTRRAYASIAALAVIFIGSAIRRDRRGQLHRRPRGHPFAGVDASCARRRNPLGRRGPEHGQARVGCGVSAALARGLPVVLGRAPRPPQSAARPPVTVPAAVADDRRSTTSRSGSAAWSPSPTSRSLSTRRHRRCSARTARARRPSCA